MNSQSRRDFLKTTTTVATAASLSAGTLSEVSGAEKEAHRPNLLFVLADQWRFSAFGHSTDEIVRTPHIDQLAQEGVNFERAYAANPVCTPNRSCLLTGRHSHQHGMLTNNLMLPPEEICWPELFRNSGYATHYVGKWHMDGVAKPGFVPPGWRRRGFGSFEGFNRGHEYHKHWGFDNEGNPLEKSVEHLPNPYYEPILQTDLAMQFMEQNKDNPFCCYLSWGPPHTPFNPPKKFKRYAAEEVKHRPNVPKAHQQKAARELAGYFGLCESLDHQMGRLMQFLNKNGLEENTLVVFSSDHGELAGSHGKYRKGEPEDESLHVPLIMHKPGLIPEKRTSQTLFNSIDIMPTLLSLCDINDPGTCTGVNLANAATGQGKAPAVESIYCQGKLTSSLDDYALPPNRKAPQNDAVKTWRTLVTDQYKLTVRGSWENVEGFYDLKNDPYELENLTGNPKHQTAQKETMLALRDQARKTGDPFPLKPESALQKYTDKQARKARSLE